MQIYCLLHKDELLTCKRPVHLRANGVIAVISAQWHDNYSLVMIPDSKVYGANMGPIWDRQNRGGPHAGPMNFAIWDVVLI